MSSHCHCEEHKREPYEEHYGTAHTGEQIRSLNCDNCGGLIKVLHG